MRRKPYDSGIRKCGAQPRRAWSEKTDHEPGQERRVRSYVLQVQRHSLDRAILETRRRKCRGVDHGFSPGHEIRDYLAGERGKQNAAAEMAGGVEYPRHRGR